MSYTKPDYYQTQGLMVVWMACYHDTNSMNGKNRRERTTTPIFSSTLIFFFFDKTGFAILMKSHFLK